MSKPWRRRRTVTVALLLWSAAMVAWGIAAQRCQNTGGRFKPLTWDCRPPIPPTILERGIKRT